MVFAGEPDLQDTSLPADNSPMVWYRLKDFSVCVPARCGSTSFEKTVGRQERFSASGDGDKYLAVRHPVGRFVSLWKLCNDDVRMPSTMRSLHGCSPDHLIDIIERFPMLNRHWIPQSHYYRQGVHCIPHHALLEHLGYPNRHENKSAAKPPENVPEARILEHYKEDVALLQLCHSGETSPDG